MRQSGTSPAERHGTLSKRSSSRIGLDGNCCDADARALSNSFDAPHEPKNEPLSVSLWHFSNSAMQIHEEALREGRKATGIGLPSDRLIVTEASQLICFEKTRPVGVLIAQPVRFLIALRVWLCFILH